MCVTCICFIILSLRLYLAYLSSKEDVLIIFFSLCCCKYLNCRMTLLIILVFNGGFNNTIHTRFNAWVVNQAYLRLNNFGGGNIHRDFDLENIS